MTRHRDPRSPDGGVFRADRRIAGLLALVFFFALSFFSRGFFHGSDEAGVFETTRSICERGDLVVPEAPHTFAGADGRTYNHFAVGQSLLAAPLYLVGRTGAAWLPETWVWALAGPPMEQNGIVFGGSLEILAVGFYAPIVSGLLVGLFFLFERRLGVSPRGALLASVLLGATTYVAAMSIYFLRHTTEALAMLGALYGFYLWRTGGRLAALVAGSIAASLIVLIRIPAVVVGPVLGAYLVWTVIQRRRGASEATGPGWLRVSAAVLLPLAVVLAAHLLFNHAKWGTWIDSPMLDQYPAMDNPLYVGLFGLLFSPGCSIFLYSPLLVLAPRFVPSFWRSHRAECVAVLGMSLALLVFHAKFEIWSGLWSAPGPRYVFALTPLLMLALGPWLDGLRSRAGRAAVIALSLAGIAVQLVLLGARWGSVVTLMGYEQFQPPLSFVYFPEASPVRGSALLLLETGHLDTWIVRMAGSWPPDPQRVAAAWTIGGLWILAILLCVWGLRRGYLRHPERG